MEEQKDNHRSFINHAWWWMIAFAPFLTITDLFSDNFYRWQLDELLLYIPAVLVVSVLTMPVYIIFFIVSKYFFNKNISNLLLRLILILMMLVLYLGLSLYAHGRLLNINYFVEGLLFFKYFFAIFALFVIFKKIERPSEYKPAKSNPDVLDDDFNFEK